MNTKHTAGQWYLNGNKIKASVKDKPDTKTDTVILELNPFIESQANAKLIAAAPEMLEALISIRDYEDRGRAKGEPSISDTWYNEVKAAIKKATE